MIEKITSSPLLTGVVEGDLRSIIGNKSLEPLFEIYAIPEPPQFVPLIFQSDWPERDVYDLQFFNN